MAACKTLFTGQISLLSNSLKCWDIIKRDLSMKNILKQMGYPNKPKRPVPAFAAFQSAVRGEVRAQNPGKSFGEITKILSEKWKQLPLSEKKNFQETFNEGLAQYRSEIEGYYKNVGKLSRKDMEELKNIFEAKKKKKEHVKVQRALLKEYNKPSYPSNPYQFFIMSIMKKSKLDASKKMPENLRKYSEIWRNLSENEKYNYKKLFQEGFEKHQKDLCEWEEKMLQNGRYDVVRVQTLRNKLKHLLESS